MNPGMPPIPPDVTAQQMPAPMRFMQGAGAQQQAATGQQFDTNAFIEDRMNQVAALLKDVADVLVVEKPALMGIVSKMAQAGSAIMSEIKTGNQDQPAPGQGDPQAQFPKPDTTAGAVGMS
jgi:hypothetical protein